MEWFVDGHQGHDVLLHSVTWCCIRLCTTLSLDLSSAPSSLVYKTGPIPRELICAHRLRGVARDILEVMGLGRPGLI